jgi:hypothetical protein
MKNIIIVLFICFLVSPGCDYREGKVKQKEKPADNVKTQAQSPQNLPDSDHSIPPGFQLLSTPEAVNPLAEKICNSSGPFGPIMTCYKRETKPWVSKMVAQMAGKDSKAIESESDVQIPAEKVIVFPDGTHSLVFAGCKPHGCADNKVFFLVEPAKETLDMVWIRHQEKGKLDCLAYGRHANQIKEIKVCNWIDSLF